MTALLVSGEILLPQGQLVPAGAVARVRLLDTTVADAPATLISEHVIDDVADQVAQGKGLTFQLLGELRDPRRSYSVEVTVSMDGSGKVRPGDLVSTQSYPVITFGYPSHVRVRL